ncbi:MAG TPA: M23 family metallopeptidase [Frankiaceae bacterium]|jgi:murein DD-endopeptidase MepM/ murein hydrolase activator NlpD|nr:M23 family metallopeptidase [Frankiaceae bacterium]
MRWRERAAAAVAALLLVPVASPAWADDPESTRKRVQAELADTADDLHESSAAVRAAAEALRRVQVELPRAQAHLDATLGRLSAARAAASASREALARAQAAVAAGERELTAARAALDESRRRSGELSRSIYMTGPGAMFAAVMRSGSPTEFADRAAFVRVLLSDGAGRVRAATDARVEVANTASVLAARRAELARVDADMRAALLRVESLADAAVAARAAVAAQVEARRRAVAAAERERAADLAEYRALQAESRRLAELIRRSKASRGSGGGGGGKVGRGGMLWPTPGPVTSGFGYRVHPIYGYRRFHAGVDIGAPSGQGIAVVLPGVVVTAGPMGTYGNLVVVDHGGGFATAYAHQSKVLVVEGQRVSRGQRIGLVGTTGGSTGPHLHFETRVDGEPVDPMRYY